MRYLKTKLKKKQNKRNEGKKKQEKPCFGAMVKNGGTFCIFVMQIAYMIRFINARVKQSNLNFSVMLLTVQFYAIEHNSQSECQIKLKVYQQFPDLLFYIGLKFQFILISKRSYDTSQKIQYNFFILLLLSFNLWIFYLERIIFLIIQGYSTSYFQEFHSSTRNFNRQQHSFYV